MMSFFCFRKQRKMKADEIEICDRVSESSENREINTNEKLFENKVKETEKKTFPLHGEHGHTSERERERMWGAHSINRHASICSVASRFCRFLFRNQFSFSLIVTLFSDGDFYFNFSHLFFFFVFVLFIRSMTPIHV